MRRAYQLTLLLTMFGLTPLAAANDEIMVFDAPQVAGISGFREFWDTPIVLGDDGPVVQTEHNPGGTGPNAVWSPAPGVDGDFSVRLSSTPRGGPTAVTPSAEQLRSVAAKHEFQRPQWMPNWQWQRVDELRKLGDVREYPDTLEEYAKWIDDILEKSEETFNRPAIAKNQADDLRRSIEQVRRDSQNTVAVGPRGPAADCRPCRARSRRRGVAPAAEQVDRRTSGP